jgi:methyltransferase (TIGR00027 family)
VPAVPARSVADRPSFTARIACTQRAAEALRPASERLFDDPFARHFVQTRVGRLACRTRRMARLVLNAFDRRFPGFHTEMMLRNRVADEYLHRALADGVDQIVNLGAGYDSTAFRIDLGAAVLYEVDAPMTQELKRRIVRERGLVPKGNVVYVPCDFERNVLGDRLAAAGFDRTRPSLVLWMGVCFFLSPDKAHAALAEIAALTAPGSRAIWDYMDEAVINGTSDAVGAMRVRRIVNRRGEGYSFGLTHAGAEAFVENGFSVLEHLRTPQLATRFSGREGVWCSTDDFMGVIVAERTSLT